MAAIRSALVTFALLLLAASVPGGASTTADDAQQKGDYLTGQFLIAAPDMGDPRFEQTVIVMVHHGKGGAFGIVVNRPATERKLADLLGDFGQPGTNVSGSIEVYAGGPVEPRIGFILHSAEYHRPETVAIDEKLALTSSPAVLTDIAAKRGPKQFIFAFGYAGWGPGQLEEELNQQAWFIAPADPQLLFGDAPEQLWHDALARRSRAL
jgi:putative transcriptional regulator